MPKASDWRLPCRAHAPGYDSENSTIITPKLPEPPASKIRPSREADAYQADRALHALAARFTGGISPVALSLAYIDWAWHLAAAPQRQMEISQDALRSASQFLESALHYFSPGQGPWSLIKPQPQDRRFARPEWETP